MKQGRLRIEEHEYIYANYPGMDYRSIAKELKRNPKSIKDWIDENIGASPGRNGINELKKKIYWTELENQFTKDELEMFQFHWGQMWQQFKDDVFHTEEMQIVDTIKLEILMNRDLRSQNENMIQIANIDKEIEKRRKQVVKETDLDQRELLWKDIVHLERQKGALESSRETLSKNYKELQSRKATMLKDLKGTREQRIKSIEDSKQTFAALLKKIITDPNFRRTLGREMEKMRIATEIERKRLSALHVYNDGVADQPFLTPETLIVDD